MVPPVITTWSVAAEAIPAASRSASRAEAAWRRRRAKPGAWISDAPRARVRPASHSVPVAAKRRHDADGRRGRRGRGRARRPGAPTAYGVRCDRDGPDARGARPDRACADGRVAAGALAGAVSAAVGLGLIGVTSRARGPPHPSRALARPTAASASACRVDARTAPGPVRGVAGRASRGRVALVRRPRRVGRARARRRGARGLQVSDVAGPSAPSLLAWTRSSRRGIRGWCRRGGGDPAAAAGLLLELGDRQGACPRSPAGGIVTGAGIAAVPAAGAAGAGSGTRFMATPEALGTPAAKRRLLGRPSATPPPSTSRWASPAAPVPRSGAADGLHRSLARLRTRCARRPRTRPRRSPRPWPANRSSMPARASPRCASRPGRRAPGAPGPRRRAAAPPGRGAPGLMRPPGQRPPSRRGGS